MFSPGTRSFSTALTHHTHHSPMKGPPALCDISGTGSLSQKPATLQLKVRTTDDNKEPIRENERAAVTDASSMTLDSLTIKPKSLPSMHGTMVSYQQEYDSSRASYSYQHELSKYDDVSALNDDELIFLPSRDMFNTDFERRQQRIDSNTTANLKVSEETKKDTTKLLAITEEQREEAGIHHADTMHGQDEIKDTLEEQMLTEELHHLEVTGMLRTLHDIAISKGDYAEAAKLKKELENEQAKSERYRRQLSDEREKRVQVTNEKNKLARELKHCHNLLDKAGMTPVKPRRGLAKAPINLPPPAPASKREAPAAMVAIGRKSKLALQEAEVARRVNSGKFAI